MNKPDILDFEDKDEPEIKRPLIITVICILGALISLSELAGHLYVSYLKGGGQNTYIIYLQVISIVNMICWMGFWTMRKLTLFIFIANIIFSMWVYNQIGMSVFDFYLMLNIVIAAVMLTQLHKMRRFI